MAGDPAVLDVPTIAGAVLGGLVRRALGPRWPQVVGGCAGTCWFTISTNV
jgi:hypothetical protein